MEFFFAASSLLPHDLIVSSNVGAFLDDKNEAKFLDFYINNSLCWGIELLREGDRVGEHLDRFTEKGQYSSLLSFVSLFDYEYILVSFTRKIKNWAVIDFRSEKMISRKHHPNYIVASYNENYSCISVRWPDEQVFQINLMGDLF